MSARRLEEARELAARGALLLCAATALRLLESTFSSRPLAAVVLGAFGLDLWGRRIGVRWDAPPRPTPEAAQRGVAGSPGEHPGSRSRATAPSLRGAGRALGLGVLLALLPLLVCLAVGRATAAPAGPSAIGAGLGLLRTLARSFRDELLFRGIPLWLCAPYISGRWALGFATALGVAPLALATPLRPEALLLAATAALLFGRVWQRGGGAGALALHWGWVAALEVGLQGGLLEVEWRAGSLASPFDASGLPAYAAAAALLAAALAAPKWLRAI